MTGEIGCEEPNADVNKFEGEIDLNLNGKKIKSALNHKNLLLRATKLKNTEWLVGIAVYTGKNTKIMMNGASTKNKISNIERRVNKIILFILLFELFCCGCSALFNYISCINTIAF